MSGKDLIMKIKKNEFIKKLEAVKPGLSNKDIIEFSDSFCFSNNSLITYNDFICVKCPIDIDIEGTVVADRFHKIVQQIEPDVDGYINLKIKDNDIIVKSKKAKAGVPINHKGKLSLTELGKIPSKWHKLPKTFQQAIRLSAFSASNDASKPVLTCLHINKNIVQSSNGERGFQYFMDGKVKQEFLLPVFSVPALLNHPIKKYNVSKNWIHFKTDDNVIISSRMYAETNYPDTDFLFNIKGKKFSFPIKLRQVLERCIIFIGEDDEENVEIDIKKKMMVVSSRSSMGWFKEKVPTKSKKEINIKINPFFLKDILKQNMTAIIHQSDSRCLMKFTSDDWQYVINIMVN